MIFCSKGAVTHCEHCPITDENASACEYAVEYIPIIHAYWIANGVNPHNNTVGNWRCSRCGRISFDDSEYCHRCGAKMDEV